MPNPTGLLLVRLTYTSKGNIFKWSVTKYSADERKATYRLDKGTMYGRVVKKVDLLKIQSITINQITSKAIPIQFYTFCQIGQQRKARQALYIKMADLVNGLCFNAITLSAAFSQIKCG